MHNACDNICTDMRLHSKVRKRSSLINTQNIFPIYPALSLEHLNSSNNLQTKFSYSFMGMDDCPLHLKKIK